MQKIKEILSKVGSVTLKVLKIIAKPFVKTWKFCSSGVAKAWRFCAGGVKKVWGKFDGWFKEKTKDVKWPEVWDKCTTGLLIFLMTSPLLILGYIVLWFVLR